MIEAADGQEGFDQTKTNKPDIVILDLMMPVLDGFGYLKLVRSDTDQTVSNVPVVVLSNLHTNKDILRAESLKIDSYFVKTSSTLEEVIQKVVEIVS